MAKKLFLFDMDGVIAKWHESTVEERKSVSYMAYREPEEEAIGLVKKIYDSGENCMILTAVEHLEGKLGKLIWLEAHGLSDIPVLFVKTTDSKAEAVSTLLAEKKILVDDYSKNLHDWEANGYTGCKFYNGINGNKGTWQGASINNKMTADEMFDAVTRL